MRIKIIGSGSMWNKNNSACYLIDDDIMVDFPNGACKYLYRNNIKPNSINNILITHFHGDHYFDLPFYITNKYENESKKVNIFCSKEGEEKINKIGRLAFPDSYDDAINYINYKFNFNDEFTINNYRITKLLVDHGMMKPAYGYIFRKDNITVGFTGDSTACTNYEYMASICNYLFCDCMLIKASPKHMGTDKLKELCLKYENCTFVVSHMNDETREELKRLNIKNIIISEDGMSIEA